ncbi:MAG: hypothetical protein NVSMB9_34670 [Isosphaeraceae bacterium]
MLRIVADLGNSRLKWGRLGEDGEVAETIALAVDDPSAWEDAWRRWNAPEPLPSTWAIASVNPPAADRLGRFLRGQGVDEIAWYRSAADVPVRHGLGRPETAGADRALAVAAALAGPSARGPGLVVLCGTAITVERVSASGIWEGGAIAAGLSLTARALNTFTAQLPLVVPRQAPPTWGNTTLSALEAGIFWGVAGTVRELLTRQSATLHEVPWIVWTGGDAEVLAAVVKWENSRLVPDLVLRGLAGAAFGRVANDDH